MFFKKELDGVNRALYQHPLLTAEEEKELARRIVAGDRSARDRFIENNQRLIWPIAVRFSWSSLGFQDLLQEGNIGLMIAVDKFNPERGCRFSTMANWWIRNSISKAIAETSRTIRIPIQISEALYKINRRNSRTQEQAPTGEELAVYLQTSPQKIRKLQLRELQMKVVNLEAITFRGKDGDDLGVSIPDTGVLNPEDTVIVLDQLRVLRKQIGGFEQMVLSSRLNDREKRWEILMLRYGLKEPYLKIPSVSSLAIQYQMSETKTRSTYLRIWSFFRKTAYTERWFKDLAYRYRMLCSISESIEV